MKSQIKEVIKRIEAERKIRVLHACEAGSRAWGFPSTDSDYDIRMIYVHTKDWYISLYEKKDTLNQLLQKDQLHFSGMELKKALNMLYRSDINLYERLQSNNIYQTDEAFISDLNLAAQNLYAPLTATYHYIALVKKALAETDLPEISLKKLFRGIRAALCCLWLIEKGRRPPVEISLMLDTLSLDLRLKRRIKDLIQLKGCQKEHYTHPREYDIIDWLKQTVLEAERRAYQLPVSKDKGVDLNKIFVKWVNCLETTC